MISTRGRYALRILVDLAEKHEEGYVTLKELARRQEISEKYLEILAKDLVRAGILEGMRGKGGGYRLRRKPEDIKVLDVLHLMEGTLVPVSCIAEGSAPCPRSAQCRTLWLWEGLNGVVMEYLGRDTVEDLIEKETDGFNYVI